jgi:hypothetical protein
MTPLCEIAYKYGTDKCPQLVHFYTQFYYDLFKDKTKTIKKVMELGIGHYEKMKFLDAVFDSHLNRHYQKGASLKMWRDFFPNAQIYGVDIEPECMFEDERIKTFLGDEFKTEDWMKIIKQTGTDIDLFIDDGSHNRNHQIFIARTVLSLLKKDVVYIIEDVRRPEWLAEKLKNLYGFDCQIIKSPKNPSVKMDNLVVVKNK